MEIGLTNELEKIVSYDTTAIAMRSGTLEVFATPAMISLIEETAWQSVAPFLEDGQATVGTMLNINHVAPTPIGMKVRCKTQLKEIDGRKLVFEASVYDETGLIGQGVHERFIITADKFQQKANSKIKSSDS